MRTGLHDASAGYNWKQFGWKLKMSVRKKCKCALEILKNIVENRASFTSEQVIVSYPREILSQPLWKSYSYVREFLSFPTMWQRNVSFRNFLCLFPYFWNWIKTSQVHWLFCQLEKFPLLRNLWCWAYLHLQYLMFWWQYHFRGIIFRNEFCLFSKMVQVFFRQPVEPDTKNGPVKIQPQISGVQGHAISKWKSKLFDGLSPESGKRWRR